MHPLFGKKTMFFNAPHQVTQVTCRKPRRVQMIENHLVEAPDWFSWLTTAVQLLKIVQTSTLEVCFFGGCPKIAAMMI